MKILITCGLKSEYNEARNNLSLRETTIGKTFPRISEGKGLILVWTGIGKVNTAITLLRYIDSFKPDLIIDSGTCGSVSQLYNIKDIVISLESQEFFSISSPNETYSNLTLEEFNYLLNLKVTKTSKIASIEDSIDSDDKRYSLQKYECDCVSWESSTVFKIALQNKIKVISIRGVTDLCNNNTFNDFKKNRLVVCKRVYNYINDVLKNVI